MRKFILLFILIFVYCSGSNAARNNSQPVESNSLTESYDFSNLPELFDIPAPEYKSPESIKASEVSDLLRDEIISSIDSSASVAGYRIQVFSSSSQTRAEESKLNTMSTLFDQVVYLSYDAPNYKIRIGNFIYREDADDYLTQNIKNLYPNAWVVRTRINPFAIRKDMAVDSLLMGFPLVPIDSSAAPIDSSIHR